MQSPYQTLNLEQLLGKPKQQQGLDQDALALAQPQYGMPEEQADPNLINGQPMEMPDPGNPPGVDESKAAKVTFGFGDNLSTPELQAMQKAIVDTFQGQQDTNEAYQDKSIKRKCNHQSQRDL